MLKFYLILVLQLVSFHLVHWKSVGWQPTSTMNLNRLRWLRGKKNVGPSIDNFFVDLGVCTTRLKVYVTSLGTYDLIIGIDWLEAH
jgi:hypothetical protein